MIDSQETQMPVRLTSLTTSSLSTTNPQLSIVATQTTQSSLPPAGSVPAVQENARPLEPHFVHRETVPATVRCLLRKPHHQRLNPDAGQRRPCPPVLSNGAQHGAMSGGTRAAVTIQSVDGGGGEPVGG